MVHERSAGIIPFRRRDGVIEYLLLHSVMVRNPDAAWEFPKGHIEAGEGELEAARRELSEESGLRQIDICPDFRDEVQYQFRRSGRQINKVVTFFTGEIKDWSAVPDSAPTREHGDDPRTGDWHMWLPQHEAMSQLFHPGMRRLLERASIFIYEFDRIQRRLAALAKPVG